MTYEPYSEPAGRDPEVAQRAADGLWMVWVWKPMPEVPIGGKYGDEGWTTEMPWVIHTRCWQLAAVLGSRAKADRWVQRWQERRKRA